MQHNYLEVTFRHGRPLAAYLYLNRRSNDHVARSEKRDMGLVVDYAADDRPIGIEITSPRRVTLDCLNKVLKSVNAEPATSDDLTPLGAM